MKSGWIASGSRDENFRSRSERYCAGSRGPLHHSWTDGQENLQLAQIEEPKGWSIDRVFELFPRLKERRNQEGVTLSGGEQQMLAVGRALCRDIKLLLLDEPYEGLAPVIVQEIEKTLKEIKELGITTIIVETKRGSRFETSGPRCDSGYRYRGIRRQCRRSTERRSAA